MSHRDRRRVPDSVHGKALVARHARGAGVHRLPRRAPHPRARPSRASPVFAANIPGETCGRCHANARLSEKYGLPGGKVSAFEDSFHGLALRSGRARPSPTAPAVTACTTSCPSSDPRSMINPSEPAEDLRQVSSRRRRALRHRSGPRRSATASSSRPGALDPLDLPVAHRPRHRLHGRCTTASTSAARRGSRSTAAAAAAPRMPERMTALAALAARPGDAQLSRARLHRLRADLSRKLVGDAAAALGERARPARHRSTAVRRCRAAGGPGLASASSSWRSRRRAPHARDLPWSWRDLRHVRRRCSPTTPAGAARGRTAGSFSYIEKAEYWAFLWGMAVMSGTGFLLWFANCDPALPAQVDDRRRHGLALLRGGAGDAGDPGLAFLLGDLRSRRLPDGLELVDGHPPASRVLEHLPERRSTSRRRQPALRRSPARARRGRTDEAAAISSQPDQLRRRRHRRFWRSWCSSSS